ncbi:AEC family transporter [Altererythrobacter sp. Root672]|uniref:AEC family transporter n=1 Tax=Altererythrobacter sp. Root672 TaxID=1736584 RepID=UPI0006F3EFA4|nr:AEC family transporter [Altererythrobacter sp. Root672]KRA83026.1 hypothetical protein ASD76_02780 [Altererythrobacter sp. Root672]
MLSILALTIPVFVIVALGFGAGRAVLFSADQFRGMGKFVLQFALPALTFDTLARRPLAEIFEPAYLAAYGLGSVAMFLLALLVIRFAARQDTGRAAILALGASSSNSAFMGYPIVFQLVGSSAAVALAHTMVIENLIVIPLALAVAEVTEHRGARILVILSRTLVNLLKMPLILGMILGAAFSATGLPLPEVAALPIEMLARASAPVALFVIGGSLVSVKIGQDGPAAGAIASAKLLLHPLMVALAILLVPIKDPALAAAAILYAAVPMLSIYPLLASRHGNERLGAVALLLAVGASFITVSCFLWLIEKGIMPL